MKVTVAYTVTFDIEQAVDKALFEKLKKREANQEDLYEIQKQIKNFADTAFECSSVKPIIVDSDAPELIE